MRQLIQKMGFEKGINRTEMSNGTMTLYFANRLDNAVQSAWLRKRLADYILACANRGEFEPDKLAEQALRALSKQNAA